MTLKLAQLLSHVSLYVNASYNMHRIQVAWSVANGIELKK